MKIISRKDFEKNKEFYLSQIRDGKIFIYPTDTIYGIGGIATSSSVANKIRQIKKRDSKPFSIIAPNKSWITNNFAKSYHLNFLNKLPGPYTLIFENENTTKLVDKETVSNSNSIGIRIPNHWISKIVEDLGEPFISTSVNLSGEPPAKKVEEINKEIQNKVDYVIDDGELNSNPSTLIDLRNQEIKEIKREK